MKVILKKEKDLWRIGMSVDMRSMFNLPVINVLWTITVGETFQYQVKLHIGSWQGGLALREIGEGDLPVSGETPQWILAGKLEYYCGPSSIRLNSTVDPCREIGVLRWTFQYQVHVSVPYKTLKQ